MAKQRIQLLLGIFAVFLISFLYMNLQYDPLARNASVTSSNRAKLLRFLDQEEQLYLVEQHIDVSLFEEFLEEPMFHLKQYKLYRMAMDLKPASPKEIVTFVNAVADRIELESLMIAIPNYEYGVLRKLIVDHSPYNHNAEIILNPNDITVQLDLKRTIGEYEPSDLVLLHQYAHIPVYDDALQLRKEVADQLDSFCAVLEQETNVPCGGFTIQQAYLSYYEIQDAYLDEIARSGAQKAFDLWGLPSHNEHQLGLAVDVTGFDLEFLTQKAGEYGFLAGSSEEAPFAHIQDQFHLRYVGIEKAKECLEHGRCFNNEN